MGTLRVRLGEAFRMLRETTLRLSQEKFALKAGLSPTFVGEIERAEKNCSVDTLEVVAKGLDMPAWEVVRTAEMLPDPTAGIAPAEGPPPGRRPGSRQRYGRRPASGDPPLTHVSEAAKEPTLRPGPALSRMLPVLVVVERTGAGFSARTPDLPDCVASGATAEEAEQAIRSAVAARLEELRATGGEAPPPNSYAKVIGIPF
jgi:predicted RNase H-like HicB family nuclease/transcriptional regulator with XRE-family HTH domain